MLQLFFGRKHKPKMKIKRIQSVIFYKALSIDLFVVNCFTLLANRKAHLKLGEFDCLSKI